MALLAPGAPPAGDGVNRTCHFMAVIKVMGVLEVFPPDFPGSDAPHPTLTASGGRGTVALPGQQLDSRPPPRVRRLFDKSTT